jgi:hypothetical protein
LVVLPLLGSLLMLLSEHLLIGLLLPLSDGSPDRLRARLQAILAWSDSRPGQSAH